MFNVSLYIDPATTSYIISIVSIVIVTLGTCIGIFWNKIKRAFRKKDTGAEEVVRKAEAGEEKAVFSADDLLNEEENK